MHPIKQVFIFIDGDPIKRSSLFSFYPRQSTRQWSVKQNLQKMDFFFIEGGFLFKSSKKDISR